MENQLELFRTMSDIKVMIENENKEKSLRRNKREKRTGMTSKLPSKTIQGQDYTVNELLIKHANGIFPAVQQNGIYDEEPTHEQVDFSAVNRNDISENKEMKEQVNNEIQKVMQQREENRKKMEKIIEKKQEDII